MDTFALDLSFPTVPFPNPVIVHVLSRLLNLVIVLVLYIAFALIFYLPAVGKL